MTTEHKPHSTPALVALRSVADELQRNGLLSHTADTLERIADDLEEQLETANRDREALAAGIGEWLGSQGYSAAERAELFSSFLDSNPASSRLAGWSPEVHAAELESNQESRPQ